MYVSLSLCELILWLFKGSRWTFQATHMNGQLWWYTIKPDQMQVVNPVLILAFIPLFESIIYPILAKLHLVRTSLQKLSVGGVVAAIAFVVSAIVEFQLEVWKICKHFKLVHFQFPLNFSFEKKRNFRFYKWKLHKRVSKQFLVIFTKFIYFTLLICHMHSDLLRMDKFYLHFTLSCQLLSLSCQPWWHI